MKKLVAEEGGRLSHSNGATVIRLAGVQASCTHGPSGLLNNWRRAAELWLLHALGLPGDPDDRDEDAEDESLAKAEALYARLCELQHGLWRFDLHPLEWAVRWHAQETK